MTLFHKICLGTMSGKKVIKVSSIIIHQNIRTFWISAPNKCRRSGHYIIKSTYPDISIQNKTFTQLIWERHEKWKHYTAIECGVTGETYTYSELIKKSEKIGRGLINEGLRQGDVVAFLLPNSPSFLVGILGAAREGLTICAINPSFTAHEIAHQIQTSGAKCIITCPEKIDIVMKMVNNLHDKENVSSDLKVISIKRIDGRESSLYSQVRYFKELEIAESKCNQIKSVSGDLTRSTAFIAYTSGTTGLPKGVCLSHKNITSSILLKSQSPMTVFKETSGSHQDVLPIVVPIFHCFGMEYVLAALYHGSKLVTLPKFELETFLSILKIKKATVLLAAPPTILFLASNAHVTVQHLKHLRCIFTGAASMGENEISRCMHKAPPRTRFVQGYGLTESMALAHTPQGSINFKSVGIPLVNTEMKVIDLKNSSLKKAFQEGEICVRGPQVSLGYLNNPKATKQLIDGEGWLHTGDVGFYDNEGYFYIVDRIKEMIKVKGFQVAPAELEAVLRSHPAVEDAGVSSIPHERKGEVPVGFIKLRDGNKLFEQELKQYLSEKVAPFKIISNFFFVDSIPRSPSGKILRNELKKLLY